jgi:glycosyltransferase involved in cell wall biosynthesis
LPAHDTDGGVPIVELLVISAHTGLGSQRCFARSYLVFSQSILPPRLLLVGANSDTFRDVLLSENPMLTTRISATGVLPDDELSLAISSCDMMIQPHPDGVTSRRTTMMAALDHGRAIVTTAGAFTEPLRKQSAAVALAPGDDFRAFTAAVIELSADAVRRRRYVAAAKALYANRFDIRHTIEALRASNCA